MKNYYLAYGSNLNSVQMHSVQMHRRCPDAVILGTGEIRNYELLFRKSLTGAYLTIEPKRGARVPVAVWEVSDRDIKRLDGYEGYPKYYYKKDIPITYTGIVSGKKYKCTAFAYIMHEDRPIGVPTYRYISTCLLGYNRFGFDSRFLLRAERRSRKEVQR